MDENAVMARRRRLLRLGPLAILAALMNERSRRTAAYRHTLLTLFIPLSLLLLLMSACDQDGADQQSTPAPPTATAAVQPTETPRASDDFVTIATDAPFPPFALFDDFGNVVGFDAELAENLMSRTDYDYEFVVTNFEGMLASVGRGEFDMAMTALSEPEPAPGVVFTAPYLDVGQVLVVLANEEAIGGAHDLPAGASVGLLAGSLAAQRAAVDVAGIPEEQLVTYESVGAALQALIDGDVRGVILDHDDAEHFTRTHYEQLRIAGGAGREAWIVERSYVIAVHESRTDLLQALNEAIDEARQDGTVERVTRTWLVSQETIEAGESLIGTPDEIIVVGVLGTLADIDPASAPSLIGWEVKVNTMSGLYIFDENNELAPLLAEGNPQVSADGLEYTINIRSGLTFPDGAALTAEDVVWSISRSGALGSWHVNSFLKDENEDLLADVDAIQALGPSSIRIVLNEPASFFPNVLATPPYFVVSQECYNTNPDAARLCSGIGPYQVIDWQPGEMIQLQANPQWIGSRQPAFENIQIRFYPDPAALQNALELGAVDIAWGDLSPGSIQRMLQQDAVRAWEGSPTFKSYLVFQQEDTPWASAPVRQAVSYAIDRDELVQALAPEQRTPLYSPLPDSVPQQVRTEPQHDLLRAQELLRLAGYSESNPLVVPLWYLNDGRYSDQEEAYAEAIAQQLEATGMIDVELNGAPWEVYGAQISDCSYATFLLGWPPVGWPTRYPAAMGWLDYFVTDTDILCSNYESATMASLINQARRVDPLNEAEQQAIYTQIQELWAQELPTLDLTQSAPRLVARDSIDGVTFDLMGLLRYTTLTKAGASP